MSSGLCCREAMAAMNVANSYRIYERIRLVVFCRFPLGKGESFLDLSPVIVFLIKLEESQSSVRFPAWLRLGAETLIKNHSTMGSAALGIEYNNNVIRFRTPLTGVPNGRHSNQRTLFRSRSLRTRGSSVYNITSIPQPLLSPIYTYLRIRYPYHSHSVLPMKSP